MSRSHVGWVAAAALGAALAGCSGNASPQTMPVAGWGEPGPESVSGTVRQVGNLPFARTLIDDDGGEGVFVTGFGFPVVPQGQARVRCQVSAAHTRADLDEALAAFKKVGTKLGLI